MINTVYTEVNLNRHHSQKLSDHLSGNLWSVNLKWNAIEAVKFAKVLIAHSTIFDVEISVDGYGNIFFSVKRPQRKGT